MTHPPPQCIYAEKKKDLCWFLVMLCVCVCQKAEIPSRKHCMLQCQCPPRSKHQMCSDNSLFSLRFLLSNICTYGNSDLGKHEIVEMQRIPEPDLTMSTYPMHMVIETSLMCPWCVKISMLSLPSDHTQFWK